MNNTKNQLDQKISIEHPTEVEYMLFSSTHGIFSRRNHMLGHVFFPFGFILWDKRFGEQMPS